MGADPTPDCRTEGKRVIASDRLDTNTPQILGMRRATAISQAMAGVQKIRAGTVEIE